jgi:hypothetical protein
MKLEELNQWIGVSANIGVLAGIIFLGLELKQNTDIVRAQTRDSMTEKILEMRYTLATSRELAELMAGENIIEAFEQNADYLMLSSFIDAIIRIWENEWYQYQQGLFDEVEMEARRETWEFSLRVEPAFISFWELRRGTYSESFTEELDSIIESSNLSNNP